MPWKDVARRLQKDGDKCSRNAIQIHYRVNVRPTLIPEAVEVPAKPRKKKVETEPRRRARSDGLESITGSPTVQNMALPSTDEAQRKTKKVRILRRKKIHAPKQEKALDEKQKFLLRLVLAQPNERRVNSFHGIGRKSKTAIMKSLGRKRRVNRLGSAFMACEKR